MIKKIVFILFVAAAIPTWLTAQDSAVAAVRYKFVHIDDTTQRDRPLTSNMILYLGNHVSNYTNYDRVLRAANPQAAPRITSMGTMSGGTFSGTLSSGTISGGASPSNNIVISSLSGAMGQIGNYYKRVEEGKLSLISFAGGKVFSIDEAIPTINWTITQDTKDIGGMSCQKATAMFRGRDYEAWFCSQLPYSNGPWKLGGLPGLIMEAYDTKKEVMFTFTAFEGTMEKHVAIDLPKEVLKTTPKEFKQYQEALQRDREANKGSANSAMGDVRIVVSGTLAGPDGKPIKPKQMNNPIEKEN
ncbi:MAG: GLPGLI family protein [Bacteroidota bacterium]